MGLTIRAAHGPPPRPGQLLGPHQQAEARTFLANAFNLPADLCTGLWRPGTASGPGPSHRPTLRRGDERRLLLEAPPGTTSPTGPFM